MKQNLKIYFKIFLGLICISLIYSCTSKDFSMVESLIRGDQGNSPAVNVDGLRAEQAQLKKRMVSALVHMLTAQEKILDATNDKEQAAAVSNQIEVLKSGNVKDEEIDKAIAITKENDKNIHEKESSMQDLDQSSKKKVAESLLPYSYGIAEMSVLNKDFSKWIYSARNTMSSLSIMDIPTIQSDFKFGLSMGPKLPGLTTQTLSTTYKLISFCKTNKLKTSGAEDVLGDVDDLDG